jgi:hypothetical protein
MQGDTPKDEGRGAAPPEPPRPGTRAPEPNVTAGSRNDGRRSELRAEQRRAEHPEHLEHPELSEHSARDTDDSATSEPRGREDVQTSAPTSVDVAEIDTTSAPTSAATALGEGSKGPRCAVPRVLRRHVAGVRTAVSRVATVRLRVLAAVQEDATALIDAWSKTTPGGHLEHVVCV